MKASIRTKWLAALRSGEYKQNTDGALRKHDCYCCLGVLCDVVAPGQWTDDFGVGGLYRSYIKCDDGSRINSSTTLPSRTLMEMLGFKESPSNPDSGIRSGTIDVAEDHPIWDRLIAHPDLRGKISEVDEWQVANRLELTALNDAGISFKDIADIIEEFIPADPEPAT